LRKSIGNEAIDSLIRLINHSQADQKKDILAIVEEKFERRLAAEISNLKSSLLEKIAETKIELTSDISKVREEMMIQNAKTRSDLIKWMFIFWAGQIAVILGVLFAFFKS
jgi:hypothetical protein